MPKDMRCDLTPEFLREVIDYDPLTGLFRWRSTSLRPKEWNTRHAGKVTGCMMKKTGHLQIRLNDRLYLAHRLAWLYIYGAWPPEHIDHKNGVGSDNRINNIRLASRSDNMCNKKKQSNNKSGYTGVRYREHHKKWEARINRHGSVVWRGYFETAQEAGAARLAALRDFHGEFATTR